MTITILPGLAGVADRYDLFICDLWGVVHNGHAPYGGVVDCLKRLRQAGRRIIFLSNAPRPSVNVALELPRVGVDPDMYDDLVTSGDATIDAVRRAAGTGAAPTCFHLGPARSQPTVDACGGREVPLAEAEMILCTGLFDDETEAPEDYRELLSEPAARGVPMICANPDVVVIRGDRRIPCAGAVADFYETLGGQVRRYGKPHAAIFDTVFARAPDIPRRRAVMIGDGLHTDVGGARRAGIDVIWVAGGIHADEVVFGSDGLPRAASVQALMDGAGEMATMALAGLRW
ncbi:MAG: TIGR01459 family HAD-type hydrolase [Alphaproteobacteria bacterium]|nr:TIGR01459 family HAD-type hydrolase [Alphaproteobacteria bacterium]MDP6567840.1 TIGR01459 family HAD-type hydrolase [Alphaproteobacteria bacterium]MDP6813364.1 TIGR01459 family HAD-type hydrolase [Alphaproteobacteria bacterium]